MIKKIEWENIKIQWAWVGLEPTSVDVMFLMSDSSLY